MNMNIGTRILLGFVVVVALMSGLALHQFRTMGALRTTSDEIVFTSLAAKRLIDRVEAQRSLMQTNTERAIGLHVLRLADQDAPSPAVPQQTWELNDAETRAALGELAELAERRSGEVASEEHADRWLSVAAAAVDASARLDRIADAVRPLFAALDAERLGRLTDQLEVLDERRSAFSEALERLRAESDEMTRRQELAIDQVYRDARQVFMLWLVAAVTSTIAVIWLLHRSISPPLMELVGFVERVGKGDLTGRARWVRQDETGRLAQQINDMVGNLASNAKRTSDTVTNVSGATAQLEASLAQQAASASQQRAAVHEITSTLSEISQSGRQISERAEEVAAASEQTLDAAQKGIDAVGETYDIMGRISEQSEAVAANILNLTGKAQSIGDIVATVNDIAERSDLLALNAAIEASAAGEQGRSFTVVADEMKALAGQAKDATKQVQSLLNDIQQGIHSCVMQTEESVKRCEAGRERSVRLKTVTDRLSDSIAANVAAFEQIIAGTNQQQIGVEQVTQAIKEISTASSDVAQGTEELRSAAAGLRALHEDLRASVQRYVVA